MQIARRMQKLGSLRGAFASFDSLDQMLRQGIDIVDFTVGDPDFATPKHIADAGIQAIRDGYTHYAPSRGMAPLRRRIADSLTTSRQVKFDAEEIVVAPGAKILVTYALLSLINPGDEVIVPDPGYPAYRSMVALLGGVPVPMPLLEERSFAFDPAALAELVNEKTRMIVINSPNNPTGGVLSARDLHAVAEIAQGGDIWVLSDEVYSEIVYDRPFVSIVSIPGMKERTVLLDSFSKTYAMTGWRLGYGAAPKDVADAISLLAGNIHSRAAEFTEHAGLAALDGTRAPIDAMVKEYRERRDLVWKGLNTLPGFSCVKPEGAFYVFPNVKGACKRLGLQDAAELEDFLLREARVAVTSAGYYYQRAEHHHNPQNVRLSYALGKERIQEGLRRMREALKHDALRQSPSVSQQLRPCSATSPRDEITGCTNTP